MIGFVGELREKKGLTTLINAYAQVNKQYPSALLIVGDVRAGEDRRVFDELHSSIPNAKIIVSGYVANHDLPSYYSVIDVLVHPSLRDGCRTWCSRQWHLGKLSLPRRLVESWMS